jgi:hypothetical protein
MKNKNLKFKISKRGQTHVEVILSIVLFVGFVFSILIFFNPLGINRIDSSTIIKVENSILKNTTLSINRIDLFLKNSKSNCFSIENPFTSEVSKIGVVDSSGNQVGASLTGGYISISPILGETHYILLFSEQLNQMESESGCDNLDSSAYGIGPGVVENYVAYDSLVEINRSYAKDYYGLKRSLGITGDFAFFVSTANKILFNETLNRHKNIDHRINAKQVPIEIIYKDLKKENGILTIAVW